MMKRGRMFWVFAAGLFLARLLAVFQREGERQRSSARELRPVGISAPNGSQDVRTAAQLGRHANVPEEIPPAGWWQIAKRTARKFSENQLMFEAAAVTFYALLSIFPAVTAFVSIYGLFADRSMIRTHLDLVSGVLPSGGLDILRDQIDNLAKSPTTGLGTGVIIGIGAALWSANQGAKAMFSALNAVYGEREGRTFIKVTAISLVFTLCAIAFLLVTLAAVIVLPIAIDALGLRDAFSFVASLARWPILLLLVTVGLAALYRFGPSRSFARWRWVTWGSFIASITWLALSAAFSWYVAHFGSYNKTYGSLGAVIGFMTWIWLSCTVLLLGAQINAEMEAQTARDTTAGRPIPIGARNAAAADSVS